MAYQVRDPLVKVPVPIGGGNMAATLLNRGDPVPDGVPEENLKWLLAQRMIEEIPDADTPDIATPDDTTADVEIPSFDPLGQKVGDVIAHLKNADDAEIARVIEIEKTAAKPRESIISFTK